MSSPDSSRPVAGRIRWLLPPAMTLMAISVLWQKPGESGYQSDVADQILLLFGMLACWSAACWWVCLDAARFTRMYSRMALLKLALPLLLTASALFAVDLLSSVVVDVWNSLARHAIDVALVSIACGSITMLVLASASPREVLRKLATLLISTAMAITFCELVFRKLLIRDVIPRSEEDFHRIVSSAWPRQVVPARKPRVLRILGLADSFGRAGEAENYHYTVERLVREHGQGCEVVNISVGGYDLDDELEVLRRFGPGYSPDIVLHAVFVGNDFWTADGKPYEYADIPVRLNQGLVSWRPGRFLILKWCKDIVRARRAGLLTLGLNDTELPTGTTREEEFLGVERKRLTIARNSISYGDEIWTEVSRRLDRIRDTAVRMGARYVMVIHPDQFQVESPLLARICERYALNAADYDLARPQRFLLAYSHSRGILSIDLLPEFRAQGGNGGLYGAGTTHYNKDGNDLAAAVIVRALEGQRFLADNAQTPIEERRELAETGAGN